MSGDAGSSAADAYFDARRFLAGAGGLNRTETAGPHPGRFAVRIQCALREAYELKPSSAASTRPGSVSRL